MRLPFAETVMRFYRFLNANWRNHGSEPQQICFIGPHAPDE